MINPLTIDEFSIIRSNAFTYESIRDKAITKINNMLKHVAEYGGLRFVSEEFSSGEDGKKLATDLKSIYENAGYKVTLSGNSYQEPYLMLRIHF